MRYAEAIRIAPSEGLAPGMAVLRFPANRRITWRLCPQNRCNQAGSIAPIGTSRMLESDAVNEVCAKENEAIAR